MVITALDTSFNAVAVIEAYKSFIWTERYDDIGDFELYVPASAPYLDKLHNDFYISCSESPLLEWDEEDEQHPGQMFHVKEKKLMIIEKIDYKTDIENGNTVLITGRSLESILQRRVIWKDDGSVTEINRDTIYKAGLAPHGEQGWENNTKDPIPVYYVIIYLLWLNVIAPTNTHRTIEHFTMHYPNDTRILNAIIYPCSYRGDNLYDVIRSICNQCEISFEVRIDDSEGGNLYNWFMLRLFKGVNHLSSQSTNGYVCFSTEFDNLISSDNSLDMSTYKTMAYFIGQGEKWSVKEFCNTEVCLTGWLRVYNNSLYACKSDMDETNIPRENVPPNDPEQWALVEDWNHSTLYTAGTYVTYGIDVYRIDHNLVTYDEHQTYAAGAVVMHSGWIYVSLVDDNNANIGDTNYWYRCQNEDQCFNAESWDKLQSILKDTYDVCGDVQDNSTIGLDRRELFVDATNVPSSYTYYPDGQTEFTYILDRGAFLATLKDKALSELTIPANRPTKNFDCEIETKVSFQFGKDYGIGDVIEVKDTFGFTDSVVVNSYIISHDESGVLTAYPTFESVESSTIITKYLSVGMALSTGTFLLKIPESTRFRDREIIAKSVNNGTTYYLMSFVKKITSDSMFSTGRTERELHMVAWTTDTTVYTDNRYQTQEEALTVGPTIVGTPMFYIDIEGGITLPGVINPSWSPPVGTDLGDITHVYESTSQYKNILIANL